MFGQACHYDEKQHRLISHDILDWCKRQTSDAEVLRRLFMYRHNIHGTFVIGMWVGAPREWFVDVLNLGEDTKYFTADMADSMRRRLCSPISSSEICQQLRTSLSDHLHELNDRSNDLSERIYKVSA